LRLLDAGRRGGSGWGGEGERKKWREERVTVPCR